MPAGGRRKNGKHDAEESSLLFGNLRAAHPEIDWRRVVGLRNVVVHEYFAVDLDVVWVVVQRHLPQLKRVARAMLEAGPQG